MDYHAWWLMVIDDGNCSWQEKNMKHTYLDMVATCSRNILLYINVKTKVNNDKQNTPRHRRNRLQIYIYIIYTAETANMGGKPH